MSIFIVDSNGSNGPHTHTKKDRDAAVLLGVRNINAQNINHEYSNLYLWKCTPANECGHHYWMGELIDRMFINIIIIFRLHSIESEVDSKLSSRHFEKLYMALTFPR